MGFGPSVPLPMPFSNALANMTLDGLEEVARRAAPSNPKVHVVRYADDFIITGTSKEVLEMKVKPAIVTFLKERGLELSEEKTPRRPPQNPPPVAGSKSPTLRRRDEGYLRGLTRLGKAFRGLLESPALPDELQQMAMVHQPIEQRRDDDGVAQELGPVVYIPI